MYIFSSRFVNNDIKSSLSACTISYMTNINHLILLKLCTLPAFYMLSKWYPPQKETKTNVIGMYNIIAWFVHGKCISVSFSFDINKNVVPQYAGG